MVSTNLLVDVEAVSGEIHRSATRCSAATEQVYGMTWILRQLDPARSISSILHEA